VGDSPTLTVALDHPDAACVEIAGGKGASLARLVAGRLPVPSGFCVTTGAFDEFVDSADIRSVVADAVHHAHPESLASLHAAEALVRNLFMSSPMPESVVDAVTVGCHSLGDAAVAVRSSATTEDLESTSFAGQLESFLNVRGSEDVLTAVRRCWASLWSARTIGYQMRFGIRPDVAEVAVVVQTLIDADAAGVLFTSDPVSHRDDRIVINAAWGLGEAVVGGMVTPDSYVVERRTGELVERIVSPKDIMTVTTGTGTRQVPVPDSKRFESVLSRREVTALAALGRRVESLYGLPVDVEWVRALGELLIVQARPITVR
jgi:rifampicin phosphotransferase